MASSAAHQAIEHTAPLCPANVPRTPPLQFRSVTRRIKADFTRILLDIAYNDRSSVTAHRSPQALAGGDHPPARKSPWLVEVCRANSCTSPRTLGRPPGLPEIPLQN